MSLAENYNCPTTFAGTPAYEILSNSAEYLMRHTKSKCGVLETGLYFGSIWPRISEF
jgi:hypothetical protein